MQFRGKKEMKGESESDTIRMINTQYSSLCLFGVCVLVKARDESRTCENNQPLYHRVAWDFIID